MCSSRVHRMQMGGEGMFRGRLRGILWGSRVFRWRLGVQSHEIPGGGHWGVPDQHTRYSE